MLFDTDNILYTSTMRKLYITFSIISLIFFIGLFVYLGVMIRLTRDKNLDSIRDEFTRIKTEAVSAYLAVQSFEADFFRSRINTVFTRQARLQLVSVSSEEDGILYLYTRSTSYLNSRPEQESFTDQKPKFNVFPISEVLLHLPFSPVLREDLIIEGIFIVLGREDIYPVLRNAFFGLLIFLLLAGIFVLVTTSVDFSQKKSRIDVRSPDGAGIMDRKIITALQKMMETAHEENQDMAFALVKIDDFASFAEPEDMHNTLYDLINQSLTKQASAEQPSADEDSDDDLRTESLWATSKLLYWEDDGFALFLPGLDLDRALRRLETVRKEIAAFESEEQQPSISVGLCSLNNRQVDSQTLIREAYTAVQKASSEGKNQVIAFRADPQKFSLLQKNT